MRRFLPRVDPFRDQQQTQEGLPNLPVMRRPALRRRRVLDKIESPTLPSIGPPSGNTEKRGSVRGRLNADLDELREAFDRVADSQLVDLPSEREQRSTERRLQREAEKRGVEKDRMMAYASETEAMRAERHIVRHRQQRMQQRSSRRSGPMGPTSPRKLPALRIVPMEVDEVSEEQARKALMSMPDEVRTAAWNKVGGDQWAVLNWRQRKQVADLILDTGAMPLSPLRRFDGRNLTGGQQWMEQHKRDMATKQRVQAEEDSALTQHDKKKGKRKKKRRRRTLRGLVTSLIMIERLWRPYRLRREADQNAAHVTLLAAAFACRAATIAIYMDRMYGDEEGESELHSPKGRFNPHGTFNSTLNSAAEIISPGGRVKRLKRARTPRTLEQARQQSTMWGRALTGIRV